MMALDGSDKCEVHRFRRTISRQWSLLPWAQCICTYCAHNALAFDYGDSELLICEAGIDDVGHLTGRQYWKKKSAVTKNVLQTENLGEHIIPRCHIEKLLKKMGDCGPYNVIENNCETWTMSFLQQLGITPAEEHQAEKVQKDTSITFLPLFCAVLAGATILVGNNFRR